MIERGARERRAYVPPGRRTDLWRSVAYRPIPGALALGAVHTLDGGREHTLRAPLDELPLLVRAGALLPLLAPDVDTLDGGGSAPGLVRLRERRYRLHVLAFPHGRTRADLGTGVRARSLERRAGGRWIAALRALHRRHAFRVQASLATLRRPFRPCRVTLRGPRRARRLLRGRAWSYDRATAALRTHFVTRRTRFVVQACH